MYRIVEVCYFEIYAECVKLVIHTYDGLGETVSKDCEPYRAFVRPVAYTPHLAVAQWRAAVATLWRALSVRLK